MSGFAIGKHGWIETANFIVTGLLLLGFAIGLRAALRRYGGGGSNGYRVRAWKVELAALAAQTGLAITVCHLPPGTSKWNKIEHRLFSQITMNWRGRPLKSHRMIVDLIGNTTTTTGLTVHCVLDTDQYPTGITYTAKDVDTLPITHHEFHGEWNYTVEPTRPKTT